MPTLVPEIQDRCVVLNGVAKTYAMTGWRVGWIIAPPDIAKAASTLQSHQTSNVSNVSQRAALAAVSGPLDDVARMREAFDRRRQVVFTMLSETQGFLFLNLKGRSTPFRVLKVFWVGRCGVGLLRQLLSLPRYFWRRCMWL